MIHTNFKFKSGRGTIYRLFSQEQEKKYLHVTSVMKKKFNQTRSLVNSSQITHQI